MSESKFSVGDYVIWTEGTTWSRHDVWGKVTRTTPRGTVFAKRSKDSDEKEFRPIRSEHGDRYACRAPSKFELETQMWMARRPTGEYVSAYFGLGYSRSNTDVANADVNSKSLASPDACRKAASELFALAAWWDEKPKRKKDPTP